MAKLTKKQKAAEGKVEANKHYAVAEAIGLVKSLATAKFDETVEVAINLGVDPRHILQIDPVRGDHARNVELVRGEIGYRGLSVLIASRPCIHLKRRAVEGSAAKPAAVRSPELCDA